MENNTDAEDELEQRAEREAALDDAGAAAAEEEEAGPAQQETVNTEDVDCVIGAIDALDNIFNWFQSLCLETS